MILEVEEKFAVIGWLDRTCERFRVNRLNRMRE